MIGRRDFVLNICFLALKQMGSMVWGPSLCDLLDQRQSPLSTWWQGPKLQAMGQRSGGISQICEARPPDIPLRFARLHVPICKPHSPYLEPTSSLFRYWRWEPKCRTALGEAPWRKRALLGAAPVSTNPGFLCNATERTSEYRPPGFLSPALCPKQCCPGYLHTTQHLPSLLSPTNRPTGQLPDCIQPTGYPEGLSHAAEQPQSVLSPTRCPTG